MGNDPRKERGLPEEPSALVKTADRVFRRAPRHVGCVEHGVVSLRKARRLDHRRGGALRFEIHWRLAWGSFLLAELLPAKEQRLAFARRGAEQAKQAIAADASRVEGHYYLAVNLGKAAEITGDVTFIKPAVAAAQRAVAIDERFDQAGPLVFLGKVFLTAPPWPLSVGNPEKAIPLLERALRLAPRPLTHLFLGEAYFEDEQYERAREQLQRALRDPRRLAPRWRREARDYLRRVGEESTLDRPTNDRTGPTMDRPTRDRTGPRLLAARGACR